MESHVYDIAIIGGSAAASAAAVYAARQKLDFVMLAKDFGGEVATSGEVENWLGVAHTTGIELADAFRAHLKANNIKPELGVTIQKIEREGDVFVLHGIGCKIPGSASVRVEGTEPDGACVYKAKAVIIATGAHPRELNVPGEKELRAKGVTYCTVCDGPLFKGKGVVVIGGGNSGLEAAIMLSSIAKHVTMLVRKEFRGDPVLIQKVENAPNVTVIKGAEAQKILGDKFVTGLVYKDANTGEEKTLEVQGVFIHIGMVPNSELAPADAQKSQYGEIVIDREGRTNIPGLFAAGDVTDVPYRQIGIAVGQGTSALLSATDYLRQNH